MAEEGAKREGTELLGLPPRKRFKVLEQQRRKEIQEEEALGSHCSDITNVMPQHRVSPKKLTSQGFLVLEKQKYKLQQQRLQENLAPAMPPLPPRPVAVKRKEAPALPLPTPPAMRLKFQGEKVHSPSSSAFKSWGSPSPKRAIKSEPAPVVPNSSPNPHKELAQKPKRYQHGTVSAPLQPKAWTMAKGTTCSINKAQEDVEMLNSDVFSSDDDVIVSTSTTSSLDLNVAGDGDTGVHVDNRAEASEDAEIVTILAPVPSPLMEDAIQDVENVAADLACSAPLEDISQAPLANTSVEAAHVEDPQANDHEEVVETAQVPTLDAPVEQIAGLSGGEESTVADVSEALVALQALGAAPESDAPTPAVPETCASPLATDSTTVAAAESHTDSEASLTSNVVEDLTAASIDNEEKTLPVPCDETYSARKDEETVVTDEVEVQEDKGAPLEVIEGGDEHETDMEQDGLLAELDERAEKLFKRMFEREGCDDEDDENDENDAQFFFASNGVNNFNSLVDMEADQDLTRTSAPEQKNGVGRGVDAPSLDDDHQVVLDSLTVHVPNKPHEKEEKPESLSRAAEDSDHESEPPIQETICKSSKEDSDWDLEMEVPDFGFGKRSGGMTQRVKAPGRWSQSVEEADKELDEDEVEEGACDVCRNADAKPSDPIVYCDGCDVPVHADCYGAPLSNKIPEGDWFCAQCQSKRPDSRNCCLCPRSGGVMKMTTDGNWAHLSCAVFVPEVFFRNADDMEGIDTSHVPSKRYLAKCCVCKRRGGACVDCTEIGCKSSFHVSCALKKDLAMEFRNGRNGAIVISFCHEHTAAWDEQQERKGRSKYKIVSREPQKPKVFQRSKSR